MTVATSTVDLSRLPAPTIIAQPSFDAIRAALIGKAAEIWPAFTATVPSDPIVKLIEAFAYRELLLRQEVADAGRGLLLAYAAGPALDQLAALVGVTRLVVTPADATTGFVAVMEEDDALRRRVVLAPESFSVAGPADAYNFYARSADGDVRDASTVSPAPGEILVSVLARSGGGAPSPGLLARVDAAVNDHTVRPLTDHVTVQAATIVPYQVQARLWLHYGPDSGVVVAQARAQLAAYLDPRYPLGQDVTISGIYAALHVEGVQRVDLTQPTANIAIDDTQAARCTAIDISFGGIDD